MLRQYHAPRRQGQRNAHVLPVDLCRGDVVVVRHGEGGRVWHPPQPLSSEPSRSWKSFASRKFS